MTDDTAASPWRPIAWAWALFVFCLCVAAAGYSLYALRPPAPLPADAPPMEFSASRAIQHDYVIAKEPHPAGSPANDRVRDYIVSTMKSLGIDTQVVYTDRAEGYEAGRSDFVLSRIPGTANTKAFALMAHFDSVPYGPGASDDCAGVISLLETARAIKASPPYKNDFIFLFTDGEEGGLLGAKAFGGHAAFGDVGIMTDLEARGTQGTSNIFDMSDGNGWLVEQMVQAVRYPVASSLSYDIYKRMPFSTDFDALRRRGVKGYDMAFVDNFAWYHTQNDKPEHLNLSTLQQHGSNALDLAQHFGNLPLNQIPDAKDAMFFNAIGFTIVRYPMSWGLPLAVLALVLAGLTLVVGRVRGHIAITGILAGFVVWAVAALLAASIALLMLAAIWGGDTVRDLYTKDFTRIPDLYPFYHNTTYVAAFAFAGIAVTALVYGIACRWIRAQSLLIGAYAWWAVVLVALLRLLPGASFLAMWPLTFSATGLLLYFAFARSAEMRPAWAALLTLFALPAIVLLTPAYRSFGATVMLNAGPGLAVLVVLTLSTIIPQLDLMARVNRWWLPTLSGVAAATLLLMGMMNNSYSAERPKLDSVSYGIDYDMYKAYWLSPDASPDEWTAQYFPAGTARAAYSEFSYSNELVMKAPAPIAPEFPGPQLSIVRENTADNVRELTIRVASPAKAALMDLRVTSPTEVFSATVFGKSLAPDRSHWRVHFAVFPSEGVDITLRIPAGSPITLNAVETFYGLPNLPGFKPRPDYIICTPNSVDHHGRDLESNRIFVARTVSL